MKNIAIPYFLFSFIFIIVSVRANAQDDDEKPTYKFDTTLKGGYYLHYKTDDSLQYLYLRKGDALRLISTDDIGNRQSLLGIVSGDFDDYFVLTHTLHVIHQENPIPFELFEKKTMSVVLTANFITTKDDFLLLHENGLDSMRLYNVKTKKTENYDFPMDSGDDRLINAIKIKAITDEKLVVTYYSDADFIKEKQKTYKRSRPVFRVYPSQ